MLLLTLAILLSTQPAPSTPSPTQPTRPTPAPAISTEAQALFDRATAAYRAARSYSEAVTTTVRQRASGLPKGAEPPALQSSTTRFAWAGSDRFSFDTRESTLFRDGGQSTIYIKALGLYTQRPTTDEDRLLFAATTDASPTFQALTAPKPGHPFGRFATATTVLPEVLQGVKGKRVTGTGLPPIPQIATPVPATALFADDTGLVMQMTWDVKEAMQKQFDLVRPGSADAARITVEESTITVDWTEARINPEAPPPAFKPAPGDKRVESLTALPGLAAPAPEPRKP
ncbi:MAG TPA: hypothetical protein VFF65_07345 [Phycisphaerales bacterium]|nr:hypothetical protein [Phycisphaerales bacterium]